jgi:hypothetical protein
VTSRLAGEETNMHTTSNARASLIDTQEVVQTALLIVVLLAAAWMLFSAPSLVSGDPCILASVANAIVAPCLWLTRKRRFQGISVERYLLAAFLAGMPLVYLGRYLVSTDVIATVWLWLEILGLLIFVTFAVLGLTRSPWFLVIGIALHGIAWDSWHYESSAYIPSWYAFGCAAVDLALGGYVATRVQQYRQASQVANSSERSAFQRRIRPHVDAELVAASAAESAGDVTKAFRHLERAHVLGQPFTIEHVRVHTRMLVWALRRHDAGEVVAQTLRTVGAAVLTALKAVPQGNTGGSNVSAFRAMPIPNDLAAIIASASLVAGETAP